ncbi:uncharacterized protein QC761_119690 [Podospora bellae-mahoneyi]|uniref:FAS1 domain-containing protein n=1 Tax=Podospora bellae-mahoneyi TaxID=2093777 RepID=A0ABR0G1D6_9PEZI|nr:hypothetical protein QC761_119690 [Podospora bellae-mahoneyi]
MKGHDLHRPAVRYMFEHHDFQPDNNATLSTLASLLQLVPDLFQTLSTAQNITLLAPSNEAFTNLLSRNPRSAELMTNPRALSGVLQYHVLSGKFLSTDFTTSPIFPSTLLSTPFANVTGGQKLQLTLLNETASLFSGYKQASSDLTFANSNNTLHIISSVLTVPAPLSQTLSSINLTSLVGALTTARLSSGTSSFQDMTLFAPSNPAFQAIGSAASGLSDTDLSNILGYHLVSSRILFSPRLLAQDQIVLATLQGSNLTIRRDGNQLFVDSASVILGDVLVGNGVVHVIDNVLNPSNTSATPDPAAATQAPAFAEFTPVADIPFTSGIVPTTTFVPVTVPLNGAGKGAFAAVPTGVMLAAGAAVLAAGM